MYDLVIFDLDGTLIDSVGDIADALNGATAALGLPALADAAVAQLVGAGARELVRRALGPSHEARVDEVAAEFRRRYQAQPVRRTSPYLGVAAALEAIGCDRAIATNKPGALARAIVGALGLAQHFVAVLAEDDVGARKPDPLIVDVLRGKVGAARARTLYVGDSLIDAACAGAAGVDLCLVTWGYAEPAIIRATPARYHIDRISQLPPLVG